MNDPSLTRDDVQRLLVEARNLHRVPNFINANLTGIVLTNMDLSNAVLTGANLTDADLTEANLTNADLSNTTIDGTNFTNATLTGARSGGVNGQPHTLPHPWRLTLGYLLGPGANLEGATLTGTPSDAPDDHNDTPHHTTSGWTFTEHPETPTRAQPPLSLQKRSPLTDEEVHHMITATPQLTKQDRCDAHCEAQARVHITGPSGTLMFCGHHYEKWETQLTEFAHDIIDERHLIN